MESSTRQSSVTHRPSKQDLLDHADKQLSAVYNQMDSLYKGLKGFNNSKQRQVQDSSVGVFEGLNSLNDFINSN